MMNDEENKKMENRKTARNIKLTDEEQIIYDKIIESPTGGEIEIVEIAPMYPKAEKETIVAYQETMKMIIKEILEKERDYSYFINNSGKQSILYHRSGWEKLAFVFGISTEIVNRERIEFTGMSEKTKKEERFFMWVFTVRAFTKRCSADATGACSSQEEHTLNKKGDKYNKSFGRLQHDVLATAHTRAKGRAICSIIGGGLTAGEMDGRQDDYNTKGSSTISGKKEKTVRSTGFKEDRGVIRG